MSVCHREGLTAFCPPTIPPFFSNPHPPSPPLPSHSPPFFFSQCGGPKVGTELFSSFVSLSLGFGPLGMSGLSKRYIKSCVILLFMKVTPLLLDTLES